MMQLILVTSLFLPFVSCQQFGIDVSSQQGDIDWSTVGSKNKPKITFAWIKGSEGITQDTHLVKNFESARKHIYQTKYYHVFRSHDRDPRTGEIRDLPVSSQVNAIRAALQAIQFDKTGREDRAADQFAISVNRVPGDYGLEGGLSGIELSDRLLHLIHGVHQLGLKPILFTNKKYWDERIYARIDFLKLTDGIWLEDHEPEDEIEAIPLAVCDCALKAFAPLKLEYRLGPLIGLPNGLSEEPKSTDEPDSQSKYYWQFSDQKKVNGINGTVGMDLLMFPNMFTYPTCEWQKTGPEKPYPSYPIPLNRMSGDWTKIGIPYDSYSRRCRVINNVVPEVSARKNEKAGTKSNAMTTSLHVTTSTLLSLSLTAAFQLII